MGSTMYKVGDKVRIVAVEHGHLFKIGEVVTIISATKDYCLAICDDEICYLDNSEIEPYPATTFQVGETYTTAARGKVKCIHIEGDLAYCVFIYSEKMDNSAYTWNMMGDYQNALPSDCQQYKITIGPTIERKTVIASVDYVDGEPDWETVEVVG